MKKLDSYIFEALNQLRSSKKQSNKKTIFNLLLEKLLLLLSKVLQNKPRIGVNSFYIINSESESESPESPLIQSFPDTPKIKDFQNKLKRQ